MNKHLAIYISNNENKKQIIKRIISGQIINELSSLKHALFSEITVNRFIDEERRHGQYDVKTKTKNSLTKSSQGQRKTALLSHIISQNPEYLIVDNVFDSLDVQAQKEIEIVLTQLGHNIPIIQITKV